MLEKHQPVKRPSNSNWAKAITEINLGKKQNKQTHSWKFFSLYKRVRKEKRSVEICQYSDSKDDMIKQQLD